MPAMPSSTCAKPSYGMKGRNVSQESSQKMKSTPAIIEMERNTAPHLMTEVLVTNAR